jgi:signal transduction histidine kinase
MVGMKERAHLLGGELRVESAAGQGTRVTADLPARPRTQPAVAPPGA